jgi:hypothetical protein
VDEYRPVNRGNPRFQDHAGKTFGSKQVLYLLGTKKGATYWMCRCTFCGATAPLDASNLKAAKTKGCNNCSHRTHSRTGTPTYSSWQAMLARCADPNATGYKNYGGRGITICERWRYSFEAFLEDMGERPAGMSLERRDVNGNYEPSNCRWATHKEQHNNRTNNHLISHNGETKTQQEWADQLGLTWNALKWRLQNWGVEKALDTPRSKNR